MHLVTRADRNNVESLVKAAWAVRSRADPQTLFKAWTLTSMIAYGSLMRLKKKLTRIVTGCRSCDIGSVNITEIINQKTENTRY